MLNSRPTLIRFVLTAITSIALALVLTWHAHAATEFKIISLQHRFANDLLPVIQPLVGEEGTVSAMQNNLIIRANPKNMAEIEQIISTLDTPRQNLKITVSRNSSQSLQRNNTAISGRKRIGNVTVETGEFSGGSRRVMRDGVAVNIESQRNSSNTNNQQFIQVLDGEKAFISVGQSIPYTQEWISLAGRYVHTRRTTELISIDTGFAVRPRAIGDLIELEVTPRFSQINQGGAIEFETLSTVIRSKRGEWLDLGSIMQQKDDVSQAILSWQSNDLSSSSQLLIKVE